MPPVTLVALWALSWFQAETIRIPAKIGVDEVTFDPSRVSALEVTRWIQLSPNLDNFYLFPEVLEQCFAGDPRYQGCRKEQEALNLHNAQLNLDRITRRIHDLDSNHYPADLSEVVAYVKRIQSFALWKETQRLAFVKSGDLSALRSEFEGLDARLSCGTVVDRIGNAGSRAEARKLARFDLANCLWKAEMRQLGEYPKQAWEKFLTNHGIREHYIEDEISD